MLLVKILSLFFGVIVIAKTMTDFKKKEENWQVFLFWIIVWLGVIFVAFNPAIINEMVLKLSNRSITVGQIVGIGFVFMLYILYRVYVKAHRQEKQFSRLIRKIALMDLKSSKIVNKK
ncbi:TPA: DUF2304 domain-containing protein [Candidatus Berkelbacteria bacterium]|uniref:DUF2304 domain-containing protein n=1 Tax=Berkelbacteria bacterium GW2011_GWE1_39_12 TaxID=1618337 RepID=A0A0G4B426_9BACT|nr:MAG: hypothetical protein UT28_C0001G0387 [Berkelbacteria bacterium GW2011_GWE1_39_12]HBO60771.1 DUF2304 domain-containing protein [Candidatus Berkelbacteria bacterium]